MKKIELLDCTLRDGGYINNWNFGNEAIRTIEKKIIKSGVEYLEIGFIKNIKYDEDRSIFSNNEEIKNIIYPKNLNATYVGMIDMKDPIDLSKFGKYNNESVDVLRVIFKKEKVEEAYNYCKNVLNFGYKVFVQPVGVDNYTDEEFIEIINKFNKIEISAFYIVDTFGVIKKKDFLRLVGIADNNLNEGISLGYHSHNNLQQAFSNAEAMTEVRLNRNIIIDACVMGMGRGAGNLNLELFSEYLNENFEKSYSIEPMLEIIDEYLGDIYNNNFWGYSLPFYLSAKNKCHPNYANYFAQKGTLTVKAFNEILNLMNKEDKRTYSKEKAEKIYLEFQKNYIDDKKTLIQLENELKNKSILLIAPGKTIIKDKKIIDEFIKKTNCVVILLNFISDKFKAKYVFSSNMRRYKNIEQCKTVKKIITSNVKEAKDYDYMINYSSYTSSNLEIVDNSGIMCMKMLIDIGISKIFLAGFDGYDVDSLKNYYDMRLEYNFTKETMELRNILIKNEIDKLRDKVNIIFLEDSLYK